MLNGCNPAVRVPLLFPLPVDSFIYAPKTNGGRRPRSVRSRSQGARKRHKATGNRLLLLGRIRELALYRAEVLRGEGFTVLTPFSREEAIAAIRRGNYDVAILTYTLSSETVQALAELIREYCPDCPVVAISNVKKEDREINPDEIVLADDGPRALIAALRRLTRRN